MAPALKRSNAPIFWLLFGAGGMIGALIGPMLVYLTGLAGPLGLPPGGLEYRPVLAFAHNPIGKAFLFIVVTLLIWHAAHRIFHTLHDLGVHAGTTAKWLCYGPSLIATALCAYALLSVGF